MSPDGLDNGLLSIAVAADRTLSLGGGASAASWTGRRGRQLQLRAARGDHLVEEPDDVRVSVLAEGPVRG